MFCCKNQISTKLSSFKLNVSSYIIDGIFAFEIKHNAFHTGFIHCLPKNIRLDACLVIGGVLQVRSQCPFPIWEAWIDGTVGGGGGGGVGGRKNSRLNEGSLNTKSHQM